jgi:predicted enzyme related to lactoylglutathione lyase
MTAKKAYPPGVPCWVDALEPDPRGASAFYRELFGWECAGPGPMPGGGEYFVAQLHGDDVAGIATLPPDAHSQWATYVGVDDAAEYCKRAQAAGGTVIVPPTDALPAGRFAVLAAPTGSSFALWEPRERTGAQRINQPRAWALSALHTRDLDVAAAFYARVFGWVTEPMGPDTLLFRLPGYVGGLEQQPVPRDTVAIAMRDERAEVEYWAVDFWIEDTEAAVARAAAAGGRVIASPFDQMMFRSAVLASPGGAIFSISQLVPERLAAF